MRGSEYNIELPFDGSHVLYKPPWLTESMSFGQKKKGLLS